MQTTILSHPDPDRVRTFLELVSLRYKGRIHDRSYMTDYFTQELLSRATWPVAQVVRDRSYHHGRVQGHLAEEWFDLPTSE
jgi:hypothetical protein